MRTREAFYGLIAELEGDFRELTRLQELNRRAWIRIEGGALDPLDWGALGFTLHSLYGVYENYFLRISKFFENNLPRETWHKALVDKMALEIPPIRPALWEDPKITRAALELLKFRHRFRNLYGEDLDPLKSREIQLAAEFLFEAYPEVHRNFTNKLKALAEGLE